MHLPDNLRNTTLYSSIEYGQQTFIGQLNLSTTVHV